ncbi:MAG: alpha/beta hydrolase, partial [Actinobacteria bacterium]|nr:alpha/beta hydrolase [Actinomycetota bacterium]
MSEPIEKALTVECDGLELAGGAWIPPGPRATVVLLHGMPSQAPPAAGSVDYSGLARSWAERGWSALWADLRSVRRSPGFFSIEGWVRDALAWLEAARALGAGRPVAVVATSAGGPVAAEAIRRGAPVDALVLLASPAGWEEFAADAHDGARRVLYGSGLALGPGVLEDPTTWGAEFDGVTTERSIEGVGIPTLVMHGSEDRVVPVSHAHRIAAHAPRAELDILQGADHNLRHDPAVMDSIARWLERTLD